MTFSKSIKLFIALVLAAAALYFAVSKRTGKNTDSAVGPGRVQRADLLQRVTISGQLWPQRRLDIKPPFAGYVEKLHVKIGDLVQKGSPLVTFSPSMGKAESNFPVRSVFAGRVTQILKVEGEFTADTGEQNLVMRIEDLSHLYVLASVPELDIAKLKIGQEAKIRVTSLIGESFTGKIVEIALSAKDKERWGSASTEFQLKVEMQNKDPRLATGMSALMDINTNRADQVLTLPHEYIEEHDGEYFVTTVAGERKKVTLGLQNEESAEIRSGVREGEIVKVIDFLSLPKVTD